MVVLADLVAVSFGEPPWAAICFLSEAVRPGVADLPWIARSATAFLKSIGGEAIFPITADSSF